MAIDQARGRISTGTSLGRLSAWMCVATAVAGAFAEVVLAWVWLSPRTVEAYVVPGLGLEGVPVTLDVATRVAGFAVCMVPMLVAFYLLHQAYEVFDAYRQGHVFTRQAPVRLRRIGLSLLALAALRPLTSTLLGLLLTAGNSAGQRMLVIGFTLDDCLIAVVGGLLLAMGHVMAEAHALAEDHSSII